MRRNGQLAQIVCVQLMAGGRHSRYMIVCQGYVPLTLDVVRVAFKVPLALHTPL